MNPITSAGIGATNPAAGVIATSPATAPEIAPSALARPFLIHSAALQLNAATSAFVATHFAAAAAALSWSAAEWIKNGRASALGAISGAVAGLVAITPAAGFVAPMPALAIGLIAGVVCY